MAASPKFDPQREEVYKWENLRKGSLAMFRQPVRDMRRVARIICKRYEIETPPIRFVDSSSYPWSGIVHPDRGIALNRAWGGRNLRTLAHELAHWISFQRELKEAPHGPKWLGTYLNLMDCFYVEPVCASAPSARKAGLKFRSPALCGPEHLC